MVNQGDQPKIETDSDGNAYVLVNGEKKIIQTNEKGEKYFVNENGEI